jgi:quinol monooxygenase YgiN
VRGYFDQRSLVEQAGLMALVQPVEQGPARYGYSLRVPSGSRRPPGMIALTWIQGANEAEKERIRAHSRQNVRDFLSEPGFISIVTGFTGLRGFTVTAWEDEASMSRALSNHHATAMQELFSEHFVSAVWTSVWRPVRINPIWVRCVACASLEDVTDDHRSCGRCGAHLPERPGFW